MPCPQPCLRPYSFSTFILEYSRFLDNSTHISWQFNAHLRNDEVRQALQKSRLFRKYDYMWPLRCSYILLKNRVTMCYLCCRISSVTHSTQFCRNSTHVLFPVHAWKLTPLRNNAKQMRSNVVLGGHAPHYHNAEGIGRGIKKAYLSGTL